MRILLDECVPRRLRGELPGHDVRTVAEMGWSGTKNGALLALMATQGFEILITVDQNLRHQQNLKAVGIGAIVSIAATNRLADLLPLMPSVQVALNSITLGDVVEITV
jgi:hypothetical protein